MTNTHRTGHDAHATRTLTMRDGTRRTVETCSCAAVRTLDVMLDGAREVSEWTHRESVLAG